MKLLVVISHKVQLSRTNWLLDGCCRGYKRFFKRSLLETSDYLKDDCLSVHCSVGVVKSHTEGPKIYSISVPPSNLGQDFGKMLESGKGIDVSFEVDGEVFAAHKLVLAARSPVFRAQLFGPMKDHNTHCIKVEDVEPPVFKVQYSICFLPSNFVGQFVLVIISWNLCKLSPTHTCFVYIHAAKLLEMVLKIVIFCLYRKCNKSVMVTAPEFFLLSIDQGLCLHDILFIISFFLGLIILGNACIFQFRFKTVTLV